MTNIAGIVGLAGKAVKLVPDAKKALQETKNLELQHEQLRRQLDATDSSEAWRRAEIFAQHQLSAALEGIKRLAEAFGEVQFLWSTYRTCKLTPLLDEKQLIEIKREAGKALIELLRTAAKSTFYLSNSAGELLRHHVEFLTDYEQAVDAGGASLESTDEIEQELVRRFLSVRDYFRWRLDPIETLRNADVFIRLAPDLGQAAESSANEGRR